MNNAQRKRLEKILSDLQDIHTEIEFMSTEEDDKWNNATEGLQQTQTFQNIETVANALSSASSNIESVIDDVEEALNT